MNIQEIDMAFSNPHSFEDRIFHVGYPGGEFPCTFDDNHIIWLPYDWVNSVFFGDDICFEGVLISDRDLFKFTMEQEMLADGVSGVQEYVARVLDLLGRIDKASPVGLSVSTKEREGLLAEVYNTPSQLGREVMIWTLPIEADAPSPQSVGDQRFCIDHLAGPISCAYDNNHVVWLPRRGVQAALFKLSIEKDMDFISDRKLFEWAMFVWEKGVVEAWYYAIGVVVLLELVDEACPHGCSVPIAERDRLLEEFCRAITGSGFELPLWLR